MAVLGWLWGFFHCLGVFLGDFKGAIIERLRCGKLPFADKSLTRLALLFPGFRREPFPKRVEG